MTDICITLAEAKGIREELIQTKLNYLISNGDVQIVNEAIDLLDSKIEVAESNDFDFSDFDDDDCPGGGCKI